MGDTTKIVIVDDDRPSVAVLENGLKDFPDVRVVATAHTCEEARLAILKHRPQLLFLDIELPGGVNGLDFLSELVPSVDWEMRTTFYTSYDKYLLQALRLHAFDFLLKPVNSEDLHLAMNRYYLGRCNPRPAGMLVPVLPSPAEKPLMITTVTNDKIVLRPHNIGYFRYMSERKLWEVVLDDFRCTILKHNTTADLILNYRPQFIQIHKTHISNINYLGMIKSNTCVMLPPFDRVVELKVSKTYRRKLLDKFYNL